MAKFEFFTNKTRKEMYMKCMFKSIYNKFKFWLCIWFCTLLLHFSTRAYLFSPDAGWCCVFSTRNNYFDFLASYGVTFQSVNKSLFKTPVFGALLSYCIIVMYIGFYGILFLQTYISYSYYKNCDDWTVVVIL